MIDELLRTDPDLVSHPHFADYYDYVLQSLVKFGDNVSDRMVSRKHYLLWVRFREKKANKERVWETNMCMNPQVRNNMHAVQVSFISIVSFLVGVTMRDVSLPERNLMGLLHRHLRPSTLSCFV